MTEAGPLQGADEAAPETAGRGSVFAFFFSRWRGKTPLNRLFWRDMILVGTAINAASSATALALLGLKVPLAVVLAVHFLPVPYNIFLTLSVWRTADKVGGAKAWLMTLGATLWLLLAVLI